MIFYLSKLGISRKSGKEVIPQTADTYVAQALFGVTCASSALVSHCSLSEFWTPFGQQSHALSTNNEQEILLAEHFPNFIILHLH